MINTMYIGSGDVSSLLSGKNTKTHATLMQRFVSGVKPHYNAFMSPIDACRTGAILEDRFYLTLDDKWYSQFIVQSEEMSVLKCSLDFAQLDNGKVVDFIELKTKIFDDYIKLERMTDLERVEYIKKKHKVYYNQIQQQMYCTGLDSAKMAILVVYSHDDEENYNRKITEREYMIISISRDEDVINKIKSRAEIFQAIKDYYTK